MLEAVKRYNVFPGGGHIPPEWGLGFLVPARVAGDATERTRTGSRISRSQDSLRCDRPEAGMADARLLLYFEWNKDRFPDPARFVQSAAEMNYKVNLWEHAFTHPASPLFTEH